LHFTILTILPCTTLFRSTAEGKRGQPRERTVCPFVPPAFFTSLRRVDMKTGEQPTALVTGSARGLGRMAATLLAEAGWAVAVNFRRNRTAALELCKRLRDAGRKVEILQGDLTRRRDVDDLVRRVLDRFGRVDALIHAVGPFIRERRRFADYTPEEIDALIDGNFRSALHAVRAVLPPMRRQGSGRIILFGFGRAGEAPAWPDRAVYAAAKTGLVSFVKSVAVEEAPFGITV